MKYARPSLPEVSFSRILRGSDKAALILQRWTAQGDVDISVSVHLFGRSLFGRYFLGWDPEDTKNDWKLKLWLDNNWKPHFRKSQY
jgi:hypothetical protein